MFQQTWGGSQAYVNYANGTNWYDGTITNTIGFTEQMFGMADNMLPLQRVVMY